MGISSVIMNDEKAIALSSPSSPRRYARSALSIIHDLISRHYPTLHSVLLDPLHFIFVWPDSHAQSSLIFQPASRCDSPLLLLRGPPPLSSLLLPPVRSERAPSRLRPRPASSRAIPPLAGAPSDILAPSDVVGRLKSGRERGVDPRSLDAFLMIFRFSCFVILVDSMSSSADSLASRHHAAPLLRFSVWYHETRKMPDFGLSPPKRTRKYEMRKKGYLPFIQSRLISIRVAMWRLFVGVLE
ncbi:hypothetical protein BC567DRAFT_6589 [Phyllosticta citribraziliensis]